MSKQNYLLENYRTAVVSAVFAWCVAIFFALALSADLVWRDTGLPERIEAECTSQSEKAYAEHSAAADKKEISTGSGGDTDAYYKARDHCIARRSAIASEWQAHYGKLQVAVAFLALLSAIGAGTFAWLAFGEARRQANAAWSTVNNSVTLERARLNLEGDGPITPLRLANHIVIRVVNGGRTSAEVRGSSINFIVGEDELTEAPLYDHRQDHRHEIISSGGRYTLFRILPDRALGPAFSNEEAAFIWGYIDYRDVFGRTWRHGFGFGFSFILDASLPGADAARTAVWSRISDDAYNYEREIIGDPT
jgi:hypothetical protein